MRFDIKWKKNSALSLQLNNVTTISPEDFPWLSEVLNITQDLLDLSFVLSPHHLTKEHLSDQPSEPCSAPFIHCKLLIFESKTPDYSHASG